MAKIAPNSPLYARFRQDFPAQAGEGLVADLNYSDTIVPIVDMTDAAGDGVLPNDLQTAWDFSTGFANVVNTTQTVINTPGFWQIGLTATLQAGGAVKTANLRINDGASTKRIWQWQTQINANNALTVLQDKFVVFLRSGDSIQVTSFDVDTAVEIWYRQIADLNGNLINPNNFSFN
tara:strand:- start:59 stop:589 length:531 start_codon:yes stop_codon:yes gene_type:complete